jgi:hypothetical protein
MSMQICYEANSKLISMNYPEDSVATALYERFPGAAPVVFGEEKETEEPSYSVSSQKLLGAVLEIISGLGEEPIFDTSYQIVDESWPGHPTTCKGAGMFKIPGDEAWYSLRAGRFGHNRCVLLEWAQTPEGKVFLKREIDVSDRSEIQTTTQGTLKIKRKKRRSRIGKELEKLREFILSLGEKAVITVGIG